jgi:phosphoribosylamine--glycine ligase
MGDPETQAVLPRLRNDLAALFLATAEGRLGDVSIETDERAAAAVVAVSEGYPGEYQTGKVILGLQDPLPAGSMIFQAGTRQDDGDILSSGGRVLSVTSLSGDIESATRQSLSVLDNIYYENIYYRSDIGYEFISSHEPQ